MSSASQVPSQLPPACPPAIPSSPPSAPPVAEPSGTADSVLPPSHTDDGCDDHDADDSDAPAASRQWMEIDPDLLGDDDNDNGMDNSAPGANEPTTNQSTTPCSIPASSNSHSRPSTPQPTLNTERDEGAPNSPIAHAIAMLTASAAGNTPPSGMAPVPGLTISDFDYHVPTGTLQPVQANGHREQDGGPAGKKRKAVADGAENMTAPTTGTGGRRVSSRLNKAADLPAAPQQKDTGGRKKKKAQGWFYLRANDDETGIIDEHGNPVPIESVPRAEARRLLPHLDI